MASFKGVLSGIGHFLAKVFNPTVIKEAQSVADLLLPGFKGLIDATATAIINAEIASVAANQQAGSGAQKLAYAIAAINAQYIAFAKANGLPEEPQAVQDWVQKVLDVINVLPLPGT